MNKNPNINPPEYTEREKDMRISALEAGAMLEDMRLILASVTGDAMRLKHNINVVAGKLDEVIEKLMTGGVELVNVDETQEKLSREEKIHGLVNAITGCIECLEAEAIQLSLYGKTEPYNAIIKRLERAREMVTGGME